jgi:hypothetical protein
MPRSDLMSSASGPTPVLLRSYSSPARVLLGSCSGLAPIVRRSCSRKQPEPCQRLSIGIGLRRFSSFDLGLQFKLELIHLPPIPVLAWLERLDDGMVAHMEALGGAFVLRIVAVADMATLAAQTQMRPGITQFQTLFAPPTACAPLHPGTGRDAYTALPCQSPPMQRIYRAAFLSFPFMGPRS